VYPGSNRVQSLFERLKPKPKQEPTTDQVALVVGLGTPGREYAQTRHNIGFQIVSQFAEKHGLGFSRMQNQALVATGRIGNVRVVIAKPQTWMNDSGRAVGPLARFYKVELTRLLIVYDDLDRPSGSLRLRSEGGHGGHNGMRSIIARLGTLEFARLRVGIGRPPGRMDPAAYVLQPFTRDEEIVMNNARARAVEATECFLTEGIIAAMNKFNVKTDEQSGAE
jgi:PTH1 family peptidyl-tRNA hydrolase